MTRVSPIAIRKISTTAFYSTGRSVAPYYGCVKSIGDKRAKLLFGINSFTDDLVCKQHQGELEIRNRDRHDRNAPYCFRYHHFQGPPGQHEVISQWGVEERRSVRKTHSLISEPPSHAELLSPAWSRVAGHWHRQMLILGTGLAFSSPSHEMDLALHDH